MRLTSQQTDRAVGSLLGAAVGDALGVPYEYGSRPLDPVPAMHGGGLGNAAPGEWSDDTAMAVCIADVAATGADLRTPAALDEVAARFLRWYDDDPPDIGVQTRRVLGETRRRLRDGNGAGAAAVMREVAADLHARTGRTASNGSLMRTAPVALAHLGDPDAITEVARAVSALTHADPVAGDACVLWCLAIDLAVRTGRLDVRVGLDRVDPMWGPLLDEAERVDPAYYAASNGWVVAALCAAWSAVSRSTSYADGVVRAVAGGGDTDTVAAIAGALLGATYGGSAVPAVWRRPLHGWPGLRARDLVGLAVLAARGGRPDRAGWPSGPTVDYRRTSGEVAPHPDDPGVLLGGVGALRPGVADAVVSLCRLGNAQVPVTADPRDHVEFWLVDDEDANLDAAAVLLDAAETVRDLRVEGKTVLVHCVHAHTRTPLVAAAYGVLVTGSSPRGALERVAAVLPSARPRRSLTAALVERLNCQGWPGRPPAQSRTRRQARPAQPTGRTSTS